MTPGPPPVMTAGPDPGRAEDRDRRTERRQGIEALDELGQDPERTPRVGVEEGRPTRGLEELAVLGHGRVAGGHLGGRAPADQQPPDPAVLGHGLAPAVTRPRAAALVVPAGRPVRHRWHATTMARRPSSALIATAALAAIVGLVFALQGLGAPIGRSFMIGDLRWTAIGVALIVAAAVVARNELRRR
jgi:hypothetical protein